jgi:hypothetical protein
MLIVPSRLVAGIALAGLLGLSPIASRSMAIDREPW